MSSNRSEDYISEEYRRGDARSSTPQFTSTPREPSVVWRVVPQTAGGCYAEQSLWADAQ